MRTTKKDKIKESTVNEVKEDGGGDGGAPAQQAQGEISTTPAERALKLLAELENVKGAAIDELLSQRDAIDERLKLLGHNKLISVTSYYTPPPRNRAVRSAPGGVRHCPICKVDGHDARKHRWQKEKKPFTQEELTTLNTAASAGA